MLKGTFSCWTIDEIQYVPNGHSGMEIFNGKKVTFWFFLWWLKIFHLFSFRFIYWLTLFTEEHSLEKCLFKQRKLIFKISRQNPTQTHTHSVQHLTNYLIKAENISVAAMMLVQVYYFHLELHLRSFYFGHENKHRSVGHWTLDINKLSSLKVWRFCRKEKLASDLFMEVCLGESVRECTFFTLVLIGMKMVSFVFLLTHSITCERMDFEP